MTEEQNHFANFLLTTLNKSLTNTWEEKYPITAPTNLEEAAQLKGGVYLRAALRSCYKNSLVVNQTLVFQIEFCASSPALRVSAKRYV